jgi:hypothetical protein
MLYICPYIWYNLYKGVLNMANTIENIVDLLIKRYETLLKAAEAKGISVWDKKHELVEIKKKYAAIHKPSVVEKVKPKKEPEVEVNPVTAPVETAYTGYSWSPSQEKSDSD